MVIIGTRLKMTLTAILPRWRSQRCAALLRQSRKSAVAGDTGWSASLMIEIRQPFRGSKLMGISASSPESSSERTSSLGKIDR